MPDALCQQKDSSAPHTPKSDLALHLADVLLGTLEPTQKPCPSPEPVPTLPL